jgi:hypothetical protein
MSFQLPRTEKVAPMLLMTMSLAQMSFGQSTEEQANWIRSGMLTLESPYHAVSTPNEIPIVFSQEPNAKSILFESLRHGSNFDFTIRGPLARGLYEKNVLLIQLNADRHNGSTWDFKGNGLIFIKTDSDAVETRSFQISHFGMERVDTYVMGVRNDWKRRFASREDPSLGTDAAALSALNQVKASVSEVIGLDLELDNTSLDVQSADPLYFAHLMKLSGLKGEHGKLAATFSHRGATISSEVFRENTEIEENLKKLGLKFEKKLAESEGMLNENIPEYMTSTRDQLKEEVSQARALTLSKDFASLTLIAFIDVRNVNEAPLTAVEVIAMDPVQFIQEQIDKYLAPMDEVASKLKGGIEIIKNREENLKKAQVLLGSIGSEPYLESEFITSMSQAVNEIETNLRKRSPLYNQSWNKFANLKKQFEEKESIYKAEQERLTAIETEKRQKSEAEVQKHKQFLEWMYLGLFVGVVLVLQYLKAAFGSSDSSRNTRGESAPNPAPRDTDETAIWLDSNGRRRGDPGGESD